MKNFYIALSAACVAASASAVEKEMVAVRTDVVRPVAEKMIDSKITDFSTSRVKNLSLKKAPAKADAKAVDYAYFRPASNIMAIGRSSEGYSYNKTLGFASSYGDLAFYNYSVNAKSYNWTYSEVGGYDVIANQIVWNEKKSDADNLVVKSGVNTMMAPSLNVEFNSGKTGKLDSQAVQYFCGGSPTLWLGKDDANGVFGSTYYQNFGLKNPQGNNGAVSYMSTYSVTMDGFNKNGVVEIPGQWNWQEDIQKQAEFKGKSISDVAMDNFTIIQPTPASAYMMTKGWGWIQVDAKSTTQLVSYIYPLDDEGFITETPIAFGYANIAKGNTLFPVFEYKAIDENGDELEQDIIVDSAVAITIEGFAGNPAIEQISMVSGFYPISYAALEASETNFLKSPSFYMHLTFNVDGEPQDALLSDGNAYFFDQSNSPLKDKDTLTLYGYAQFMTDATFPYINASEESVNVPLEGGKADLEIEALYYDVNLLLEQGVYELAAPDWVKVEFGNSDKEKGITPMTLTVAASDTGRTGVVSLKGLGVSGDIKVVQGEGSGVGVVVADKDVKYYDLTGRRVLNPEKGAYIKMTGNKSEKVMF